VRHAHQSASRVAVIPARPAAQSALDLDGRLPDHHPRASWRRGRSNEAPVAPVVRTRLRAPAATPIADADNPRSRRRAHDRRRARLERIEMSFRTRLYARLQNSSRDGLLAAFSKLPPAVPPTPVPLVSTEVAWDLPGIEMVVPENLPMAVVSRSERVKTGILSFLLKYYPDSQRLTRWDRETAERELLQVLDGGAPLEIWSDWKTYEGWARPFTPGPPACPIRPEGQADGARGPRRVPGSRAPRGWPRSPPSATTSWTARGRSPPSRARASGSSPIRSRATARAGTYSTARRRASASLPSCALQQRNAARAAWHSCRVAPSSKSGGPSASRDSRSSGNAGGERAGTLPGPAPLGTGKRQC